MNGADSQTKPTFEIPSMREIEQIPHNGYDVVSTFSGAGGSCLGYRMAGYRVLWSSEFIPAAQKVYKANHPDSILDTRDIRDVSADSILDAIDRDVGELDILDGSPPCASFATSGVIDKGWDQERKYSDTTQRVDDLFFEYARILDGLKPKVFIAENVEGLVSGKSKGYFKMIFEHLQSCGYDVRAKVLDARWLGVPQRRRRVIFQGVRDDIDASPVYPDPLPYMYTTRDVLPHVTYVKHGGRPENWKTSDRAHPTVTQWVSRTGYFSGGQWICETNDIRDVRHLTIDELKRIFTVPDDFELSGDLRRKWERIVRMVPPRMMQKIAETIQQNILDQL